MDSVMRESGERYPPTPDSVSNTYPSNAPAEPSTDFTPESDKETEEPVMESCRTHGHEDYHHDEDTISRIATTSRVAGTAITPFLKKNIPTAYAPTGVKPDEKSSSKDPSTKFCYRHRPDLKCRRTANEPSMDNLQRVSVGW